MQLSATFVVQQLQQVRQDRTKSTGVQVAQQWLHVDKSSAWALPVKLTADIVELEMIWRPDVALYKMLGAFIVFASMFWKLFVRDKGGVTR
jgi:hypothetical protein